MKNRTLIKDLKERVGETVILAGWVAARRNHGKLIFLDLRDASGEVQMVVPVGPAHEAADKLRPEWVIEIIGQVNKRPEKMINPEISTGEIEIEIKEIKVLNEAVTAPFDLTSAGYEIDEEVRLKYRYLDLRRPRLQKNIRARDQIISFFRNYMRAHSFIEIETPILMKGTPEGSREYIVPSRLQLGKFYALPQSPQQFKQLAMIAGFEKYFQIARCFRDEDTRGDRQPEFTQLDYEMSFVNRDEVLEYTEKMFVELVRQLYSDKKISTVPFPQLTYDEAMKKYATDKPDLRQDKNDSDELAFVWLVDFPMFEPGNDGNLPAVHNPFCAVQDEDKKKFMAGGDFRFLPPDSFASVLQCCLMWSCSIRNF